jgi:hypothetical protein
MSHLVSLSLRFLMIVALAMGFGLPEVIRAEQTLKTPETAPKIKFDELTHDFGKVPQQATLEHTFVFKNVGSGILHVKDVKAG